MKVTGPTGVGSTGNAGKARPVGGSGFNIPSTGATTGAAQTTPTGGVGGVIGVDALLALQDVGGPLERRRKAVGRAGRILDVLDDLRMALIGGDLSPGEMDRLRRAVRDQRDATDDPNLESVLDEIETRAAVELAKLECASKSP
jgi:hypothetical protein